VEECCKKLGGDYVDQASQASRQLKVLKALADAAEHDHMQHLPEHLSQLAPDDIEITDAFRIAGSLLELAAESAGSKRELNDAAYSVLELAVSWARENNAAGLAHYHLDQLSDQLPKTRLSRFRQALGDDPRPEPSPSGNGSASASHDVLHNSKMLRTFGAMRVEGAEDVGSKLESKTRTLVAALVVARLGDTRSLGELTRDCLADLLWPDMQLEKAVNNLHATLSYARRFLGGSTTVQQHDGVYELGEDVAIDAVEFRESIKKANRLYNEGVYFGAAVAYRQAIDLATGDFLEGMYAEWVDSVREMLRGELATALERLIALELDRENHAEVPPLAERLLSLDDLHDGAYEALIRSAAARGARREAFSYFNRYEAALDVYGAGPARKVTELMNRVRAGEA
jgi:DNA-binding SARP family transcriptional activator